MLLHYDLMRPLFGMVWEWNCGLQNCFYGKMTSENLRMTSTFSNKPICKLEGLLVFFYEKQVKLCGK